MKIAGTALPPTPSVRRREQARNARPGAFASSLEAKNPPQGPAAAAGLDPLSGILLVAQEVGDEGSGRRQAGEYGESMLTKLEQIRIGLLDGHIPDYQLTGLLTSIRERRPQVADPRIAEVLDEIELRAAVELAKFQRRK